MKVRIQTSITGPKFVHKPGDEVEVEDKEAARMIKAGYAIPIGAKTVKKETATKTPAAKKEKATKKASATKKEAATIKPETEEAKK